MTSSLRLEDKYAVRNSGAFVRIADRNRFDYLQCPVAFLPRRSPAVPSAFSKFSSVYASETSLREKWLRFVLLGKSQKTSSINYSTLRTLSCLWELFNSGKQNCNVDNFVESNLRKWTGAVVETLSRVTYAMNNERVESDIKIGGGTIFGGSQLHFCRKFRHNSRTVGSTGSATSSSCSSSNFAEE